MFKTISKFLTYSHEGAGVYDVDGRPVNFICIFILVGLMLTSSVTWIPIDHFSVRNGLSSATVSPKWSSIKISSGHNISARSEI